jgi:hypothetical protein
MVCGCMTQTGPLGQNTIHAHKHSTRICVAPLELAIWTIALHTHATHMCVAPLELAVWTVYLYLWRLHHRPSTMQKTKKKNNQNKETRNHSVL